MSDFILCENLVKIYRIGGVEVQALQGLDLTVRRGELLGIVGASGSGKSTLLNVLGGVDRPTGGRVIVAGMELLTLKDHELDEYRRITVGFVWQMGARNLIPYLNALENVELPLVLAGKGGRIARSRATDLLALVGLANRKHHYLHQLSGGEAQRVGVAIALVNNPVLILADEPTGEVDSATANGIYQLFQQLNRDLGVTIIIVSHDPNITHIVDRVVAVRDGKLTSETVRRSQASSEHAEELDFHEVLLLDSAGRLQIPREHLQRFGIRRRAMLDLTEQGILIRKAPEVESQVNQDQQQASEEELGVQAQRTHTLSEVIARLPWPRRKPGGGR